MILRKQFLAHVAQTSPSPMLVEVARADGLGALTFGRVARHVGTNDRTVVYYFPTKADLIGAVLVTLGAQLQDLLAEAFGEDPIAPDDLVKRAWPVLARADSQPVFALFFPVLTGVTIPRDYAWNVLKWLPDWPF